MKIALLICAIALTGCVQLKYKSPDGAEFTYQRPMFGTVSFAKVDIQRGSNHVTIDGYKNDTVEAMKAAFDAGLKAGSLAVPIPTPTK